MNCRRVSNLLSAYMDGELTGVEMLEIRRHLGDCCSCCLQYEELREGKMLLSHLPYAEPRVGLAESICARVGCVEVPGYQRLLNRVANYGRTRITPVAAGCLGIAGVLMFLIAQPGGKDIIARTQPDSVAFASSVGIDRTQIDVSNVSSYYTPRSARPRSYIPNQPEENSSGGGMFTLTSFSSP